MYTPSIRLYNFLFHNIQLYIKRDAIIINHFLILLVFYFLVSRQKLHGKLYLTKSIYYKKKYCYLLYRCTSIPTTVPLANNNTNPKLNI